MNKKLKKKKTKKSLTLSSTNTNFVENFTKGMVAIAAGYAIKAILDKYCESCGKLKEEHSVHQMALCNI